MSELYNAVYSGDLGKAVAEVKTLIEAGATPQAIIDENMVPAMEAIGKDFEDGSAFVPNLLLSARAMKGALEILRPLMNAENVTKAGTAVIGTVKGDLHDIGKNLVASMLEGRGFEVVNLGADVSKEKFIEAAKQYNADLICLSALLTTTMAYMKEIVDAVKEAGLSTKVMVGGAPLSAEFAAKIGADGYSSNANEAVDLAKSLVC